MAVAYSADLRERVLAAVEAGEAVSVVARRFAVSRPTVEEWAPVWRRDGRRESGKVEAAPRPVLEGANHLTLAQFRDRLAEETRVSVHLVTVHRALARMNSS